ncbi:MAG: hypothetical protein C0520_02200 [Sphingopyxis sp.]|nr:hypothetical protein [Sphingopyxis sp.]
MGVSVDMTGSDDQSVGIDHACAAGIGDVPDPCNFPVPDPDVGPEARKARAVDDRPVLDDEVESVHDKSPGMSLCGKNATKNNFRQIMEFSAGYMMDNELETDVARRTQARILDAANQVIAKVGYKRLRMGDVAKGSGITRQTIYNYFPNKQQLATAVLLREGALVNERAKENIPDDLEGEALLSAAVLALVDAARAMPIFEGLFEEGSMGYVNELAEHSQVIERMMHDYWAPVIERIAATGRVRGDIPVERIEWWLSFVYRALLQRPAEDLDDRAGMDALVRDFLAPTVMAR